MTDFDAFDAYVRARVPEYIDELKSLLRQPTVSAQGIGIADTARIVLERTRRAGLDATALSVDGGPPTIVGEIGRGARTLLVYNHYDVQPPDPLDEWETPPFEPTERDGYLFGRGTSDNKGNLMARLQAIEAYRATIGELPLRIRILYEGEEESGSAHLAAFVERFGDRLRADGCLWEAGYKDAAGRPTISCGLKGIAYVELRVRGASKDAHSSLATIVPNPAWRLVWALATLKNERDEITIDGFMDRVRPPTPLELQALERLPFDEQGMLRIHGIKRFVRGLSGIDLKKKHFFEPTCTICGIVSGYSGAGSKTVLPAVASAKIDFRLVPDLTPEAVVTLLRAHLDRRGFGDIEILPGHGEPPSRWPTDSIAARAAVDACRATYGAEPVVYPLLAGSGPMAQVCDRLGIPVAGFGAGNAASANHAPNENIAIADYVDHIRAFGRFLHAFAGRPLA
ncbi:MAG TPA: M20/M25/M40 family metallo-hydrolase [Candidatus Limnocylindria bacterium]|nr:M20/M25/M40 family metallo-hydrolase [Candidatus Limnocylindria bacterium]